jgi:AraC family transcriptional regulator
MSGGAATYVTRAGRYRVDDGSYLLLDHGTGYTVTIDEPLPVESFCVFFGPGVVEGALQAFTTPEDRLLDGPAAATLPGFFERTYPHDRMLTPLLMRLRTASARSWVEAGWWDEHLHALAARLLELDGACRREAAATGAARRSTRDERYARLHRARDYMEASLAEPLLVGDLAHVAGMAPFHFLRTFSELFGATPHQYMVVRRLERAKHLLLTTEVPVTDISTKVGFASLGSFSWLFRRRIGVPPEAFRRLRGRIGSFEEARSGRGG